MTRALMVSGISILVVAAQSGGQEGYRLDERGGRRRHHQRGALESVDVSRADPRRAV